MATVMARVGLEERRNELPARGHARRAFLTGVAGVLAASPVSPAAEAATNGGELRSVQAYQIRLDAARAQRQLPAPDHLSNGDETAFDRRIASHTKGLPHDALGEVDRGAYDGLVAALLSQEPADLERVTLGCPGGRKLVNPMAGVAFDLQGADSHRLIIPPAPRFDSAEQAAEMAELYWQALLRDVPFSDYRGNPLAGQAAADLSRMQGFRGPTTNGRVTPDTLFRGFTPGDLQGPYISQFLYKPIPYGAQVIDQRIRTYLAGVEHVTHFQQWLDIQNGCLPSVPAQFDAAPRYVRNGRDLARWVHMDVLFQAYYNASVILLASPDQGGMGAPLNPGNPYTASITQTGFGTFGAPHINAIVAEVATRALKAVWFQKWYVHRRLRPEVFGGRVDSLLTGRRAYPIHQQLLNSPVLDAVLGRTGSRLLPQAFPEGCPLHPSYGAGHATVAGACVTVLKAFFDETFVIPDPVMATWDGTTLDPYVGAELTVRGELDKLAANIALGRNFAGIHWRSDYTESLKLGETVAIALLIDQRRTYKEGASPLTFTRFDGSRVAI